MSLDHIPPRIQFLQGQLQLALAQPTMKFDAISTLNAQGLYIIFHGEIIIYIGKTGRNGKIRLREMTSDYRSHTLNRKLLKEHFEKVLGLTLEKFNQKTKENLITEAILNLEQFIEGQRQINNFIRSELGFKFYEFENPELASLEHFAISIFNPKYND